MPGRSRPTASTTRADGEAEPAKLRQSPQVHHRLISDLPRMNCWTLAEHAGLPRPRICHPAKDYSGFGGAVM